jgi:hypothetical protein
MNVGIFHIILSVPLNIVMNENNIMIEVGLGLSFYIGRFTHQIPVEMWIPHDGIYNLDWNLVSE